MKTLPVALALVLPLATANAQQPSTPVLVEWADHARDAKGLIGNPTWINSLFCSGPTCRLTTISIGKTLGACPLIIQAETWDTRDHLLGVEWGREGNSRTVEVEVTTLVGTVKRRLVLRDMGQSTFIVESASGAVIATRPIGGGPVKTTEIVAFVKATPGFNMREWLDVDTGCREMSVIAAKRNP